MDWLGTGCVSLEGRGMKTSDRASERVVFRCGFVGWPRQPPDSKHWFTTSFLPALEEGAGKRCSECGQPLDHVSCISHLPSSSLWDSVLVEDGGGVRVLAYVCKGMEGWPHLNVVGTQAFNSSGRILHSRLTYRVCAH